MSDGNAKSETRGAESAPDPDAFAGERFTADAAGAPDDVAADGVAGVAPDGATAACDEEYVPPDGAAYRMLVERAAKAEIYRQEILRVKADLDNYQKRVRRERPSWEATAVRSFIRDLLPVVDNFERALETSGDAPDAETLLAGVRMIYQMLEKALADHGVVEIDAIDRTFDPAVHEAVFEAPVSDRETGAILDVQQRGYLHRDVIVRPALVVVAKKVGGAATAGDESTEGGAGPGGDAPGG